MLGQSRRAARICLADGNACFGRPNPRLSDSAEILAETPHPDVAGRRHHATARLPMHACRKAAGVAAMALLWFAAPALAATSAPYAYGGSAKVFQQHVARFRQSGEQFRITGHCQSACTMFLALPNVCIEPGAELLFHAGGHEFATRLMINSYNTRLRHYLRAQHAMDSRAFHTISGRDMISRFGYRACR
jgi:hypothetical protein